MLPGDAGKIDFQFISSGVYHYNLDQVFIQRCVQTLHANRTKEIYSFSLFRIKQGMLDAGVVIPLPMHHQQTFLPPGIPDFKNNAVSHL
jgi:hypothetical protein